MYLLIPAAGSGRRMNSEWLRQGTAQRNKLLLNLLGKPLLAWTLLAADASTHIDWIGIIGQPSDWDDFTTIVTQLSLTKPIQLIEGGSTRQESVYNGLQALPPDAEYVLIHDGARCLATPELFDRCAQTILTCVGLIAAIPVKDTIKVVDEEKLIKSTPDRKRPKASRCRCSKNVTKKEDSKAGKSQTMRHYLSDVIFQCKSSKAKKPT